MAIHGRSINARSWLFAPGDSERKMEKATAGAADIVIFDLEDAVAEGEKPKARVDGGGVPEGATRSSARGSGSASIRSRVRTRWPTSRRWCRRALAASCCPSRAAAPDVELLDHYLTALEVAAGIEPGSTKVIVLVTETAEGMFTTGSYAGAPRLVAMTWGAEDLADALGASENRNADGSYDFTYELARSLCLLGAAAAGVVAIETIHGDFRDEAGLRKRAAQVRRAGYRGMLAIHPAQVDVINEAFTPSAEELAAAQEIVDLFAANPGAGTIGYKGAMLDRPHLARAQAVLALAARR